MAKFISGQSSTWVCINHIAHQLSNLIRNEFNVDRHTVVLYVYVMLYTYIAWSLYSWLMFHVWRKELSIVNLLCECVYTYISKAFTLSAEPPCAESPCAGGSGQSCVKGILFHFLPCNWLRKSAFTFHLTVWPFGGSVGLYEYLRVNELKHVASVHKVAVAGSLHKYTYTQRNTHTHNPFIHALSSVIRICAGHISMDTRAWNLWLHCVTYHSTLAYKCAPVCHSHSEQINPSFSAVMLCPVVSCCVSVQMHYTVCVWDSLNRWMEQAAVRMYARCRCTFNQFTQMQDPCGGVV